MLSLNDLHSQLDEILNINSIESSFSKELYTDLINEQRSLFIRNEYNKNRSIDIYVQQSIPCLELELVSPTTCCISIPGCDKILRSKLKIPNTIEFNQSKGVIAIGPVNITMPRFKLINYQAVSYVGNGRTNSRSVYAFFYEEYLWVFSKDMSVLGTLEKVSLDGIFEDPTSLGEFKNCEDSGKCWSYDSPYPINQWMWAYLKGQIIQQLSPKLSLPLDDSNDAKDSKINEGKAQ